MWLTAAVMLPMHQYDAMCLRAEALCFSTNVAVVTQLGIYNLMICQLGLVAFSDISMKFARMTRKLWGSWSKCSIIIRFLRKLLVSWMLPGMFWSTTYSCNACCLLWTAHFSLQYGQSWDHKCARENSSMWLGMTMFADETACVAHPWMSCRDTISQCLECCEICLSYYGYLLQVSWREGHRCCRYGGAVTSWKNCCWGPSRFASCHSNGWRWRCIGWMCLGSMRVDTVCVLLLILVSVYVACCWIAFFCPCFSTWLPWQLGKWSVQTWWHSHGDTVITSGIPDLALH